MGIRAWFRWYWAQPLLRCTGVPFLHFLPPSIRYVPVYLTVPLGICAIVFGFTVLYRMRGDEGANRRRARVGVALGAVALAVPVILVVWLSWAL